MKKVILMSLMALASSFAVMAQEAKTAEAEVNQYGQKVNSYPAETTVQDGILVFQNKDQNYKFWFDIPGISEQIRKAGVENQVIVKTNTDKESLELVKKYAPDFMFVPMIRTKDEITDKLIADGINVIGAEILFDKESDDVISDEYIAAMHEKGLLIWAKSIVYDEKAVISAYHTDDISLYDSPEKGWGWLIDKNVDFIQTDWLLALKLYIESRNKQ